MNLTEANSLGIKLMREHGLLEKGWHFKLDSAPKRFGICRFGVKQIGLSKKLTQVNDEAAVRDTILHEIAHALVGAGHGHDLVWRRKCLEIGGDGEARYDSTKVTAVPLRYKVTCDSGCQKVSYMARAPKRARSCRCGGSRGFDRNRLLTVTDTRTGRDVTVKPTTWMEWDTKTWSPIRIVDVPTLLVAANDPAPTKRESLKRVDSHEWQTRDGRLRFVRGWAELSERTWVVVDARTGQLLANGETFPTLSAAKEAVL